MEGWGVKHSPALSPNRPNVVDLAANRCPLFVKSCEVEDVGAPAEAGEKRIEALFDEPLAHFEVCTRRCLVQSIFPVFSQLEDQIRIVLVHEAGAFQPVTRSVARRSLVAA
ncbi:Hypothetical predicted protein [Cloeon dipterum]|uniref:Uncharacterized protein n=1 Tax=Cloeon dipterum TaxID=197152 RepID=A0A8S1E4I3_9INSE|nr:Hypothetical predicted protein [Cloeon dipterum]